MRRIVVERLAARNVSSTVALACGYDLEAVGFLAKEPSEDIEALDEALTRLAAEDPAKAELVKLRFFAGLTMPEIAQVLRISLATAECHWNLRPHVALCRTQGPGRFREFLKTSGCGSMVSAAYPGAICHTPGGANCQNTPWFVLMLPYVKQAPSYNAFNTSIAVEGPALLGYVTNSTVTTSRIASFQCPSDNVQTFTMAAGSTTRPASAHSSVSSCFHWRRQRGKRYRPRAGSPGPGSRRGGLRSRGRRGWNPCSG